MPTFDTPEPITATLEVIVGDVRVTAEDRADTVVEVRPSDPGTDLDVRAAEQTRIEYADGRLLVRAPKQRGLGLFGKPGSIDVDVVLPAGSQLHADAGIATLSAAGPLGACRVRTGVGDVRLERTGPLEVETGTGSIIAEVVTGDARITTGSGELQLGEITGSATVKNANGDSTIRAVGGDLSAKAGNGDVLVGHAGADVTAASSNGDVRVSEVTRGTVSLRTALGELEAGIPAGTVAYLDLHTQFGTVRNRLDEAAAPSTGDRIVEVRGRTSYGDIVIRRP